MPSDVSQVKTQLLEELKNGDITLPSLPNVAQRIHSAFEDNLVTPQTIGVILYSDPIVSAKMIRVANSPLYAGRVPIEDVNQAVTRLGLNLTRNLVMGFMVKDLFDASSSRIRTRMQAVWKHSVHVASLCRLLSENLSGFDREQAQLAGLVHNIGDVVIVNYVKDMPEIVDDDATFNELLESSRPQVSGALLEKWNFAPEFIQVGQEHGDWLRNKEGAADLCDLVILARYHALIGTSQQRNLPPIATLPAFTKANMNELSIEEIIQFLEASREKLKSISESLGVF